MGKLLPECFVCEQIPINGINQGIILFKKFLCEQCQNQILEINNEDSNYQHILGKIRELWETHPKEKNRLIYQRHY